MGGISSVSDSTFVLAAWNRDIMIIMGAVPLVVKARSAKRPIVSEPTIIPTVVQADFSFRFARSVAIAPPKDASPAPS
jgi:hypothetical protein